MQSIFVGKLIQCHSITMGGIIDGVIPSGICSNLNNGDGGEDNRFGEYGNNMSQ